ncbi:PRA1 family protein F3-like [Andrographis paniculata]|uniref:PRA1 family protein F3-like n=1 Tax=Andrographis paniculata TaxID=175694 RepID=UPI0021E92DFB|nr:PRA1 family protein F3-like [Andrographis paniculata]
MTSYGTIPTSSGAGVDLEYISRAKERLKAGLGTRRPWRQMVELHSFGLPKSVHEAVERVKANVAFFRMNYVIVVLFILFLSLLWHPISLIVFLVMMAVWLLLYFLRDQPLVVFGRLISDQVVLIVLSLVTLVVLFLTDATINILVSLLVGVVVVLIHAAARKTDDLFVDEETGGLLRSAGATSPSSS